MNPKVFVAVYTYRNKHYCDELFISSLKALTYPDKEIHIIDNSVGTDYTDRLRVLAPDAHVSHIDVVIPPNGSLPHEHITQSANRLREEFLKTDCEWFLILESDVIAPPNVIELIMEVNDKADIIGGIYYTGYHNAEWFKPDSQELVYTDLDTSTTTILSGCTAYSRNVISRIPFRYARECLAPFPDAFMCHDAFHAGFESANYTKIKCEHIHTASGSRGW